MKINTKADYLRINYGNEKFNDMSCYKGYTRNENFITFNQRWVECGKVFITTHNIDLTDCEFVEVWEKGICTGIEERN